MSFQQKSFWVHRDAGVTTNGEMNSENSSKIEPKRGHQWFMDGTSPELLSNKRQATESIKENAIPEVSIGVSSWDNNANIQPISGPFTGRLFGSQSMKSSTLLDRNIAPFSAGDANYVENPFANGSSSMSLSMSHVIEDSSSFFNYGGLRKVRINQVREQEKSMPSPLESFYRRANDSAMTMDSHYSKTDASTISLGPSHPDMNENSISMTTGYSKGEESFLSMGHGFSKEGGSFIPMGHIYKVAENFIPMNPLHKDNDDSSSICHSFDKFDANTVHIDPTPTYVKSDSGFLSMGHTGNGVGNTVCFGGFSDGTESNASGAMIGSYELVLDAEGSVQASEVPNQKTLVDSNAYTPNPIVNTTSAKSNVNSRADNTTKNKDPKAAKKPAPNNFPSNVKSLLSTGILDGVPVKYVSWSREKNMRGIIKGTGYLCGCSECNHTKSLNAYEFERHADCKTKHPNNHIYFDNGKTIYAVVQELKNTPQEMLFDAIQTVTGSAINQKNFLSWKASYQAATRELQRIYGKDEVKLPC